MCWTLQESVHPSAPLQCHCEWHFFAFIFSCSFCVDNIQALAVCVSVCVWRNLCLCNCIRLQVGSCTAALFSANHRALLQGINVNKCCARASTVLRPTKHLTAVLLAAVLLAFHGLIVSALQLCSALLASLTGSQFKLATDVRKYKLQHQFKGKRLTYVLKRKSCTKCPQICVPNEIYLKTSRLHIHRHTYIHTYKMAALGCSQHSRHSLPLTFPLYLSACPLRFICLYSCIALSRSRICFPVCLSVCLPVC